MLIREKMFQPYTQEGRSAIFLTGRSLEEIVAAEDEKMRPIRQVIYRHAKELGMVLISYSFARGIDWAMVDILNPNDQKTISGILKEYNLHDLNPDNHELPTVLRGIHSLLQRGGAGATWADGKVMKFLVLLEFAEHQFPCLQNGTQTREQLIAIETILNTSQNLAMRKSGNFLIVHGREGMIDHLLINSLYSVHLPQPTKEEILAALPLLQTAYPLASFDNLDDQAIASLVSGTPLRPLEAAMRASHFSGKCVTARELTAAKEQSIIALSEGTLSALNTERVKDVKLRGQNIQVPAQIVWQFAKALKNANPAMPANIIFVGSPGTAKTDLALKIADEADAPAFEMHSPKGSLVGETERKVKLMQGILRDFEPHIVFCDEISEALPMQRNEFDGDSGASKAVTAGLLSILSDESRRGKSLLIGTTNRPWAIGEAMRSRFIFIPVLHPLITDFPAILVETSTRISTINFDDGHPLIQMAVEIFYQKGANPRHIRAALAQASLLTSPLTPQAVLFAAEDFCASSDLVSAIYADLWGIKVCSYRSFLPWSQNPSAYAFPKHLQTVVDPATGDINHNELERLIEHYRPHANV